MKTGWKRTAYKKIIIVIAVLMLIISMFFLRNTKTPFQKATGPSSKQSKVIENVLKESSIGYNSDTIISISDSKLLDGMDEHWEAYDLINNDESKFLLIVRKSDKDFTALLDSNNNLIAGIIDNGVLPKYFEAVAN